MRNREERIETYTDMLLLAAMLAFLMIYFDIRYLLNDTVVTGGDTASWHGVADHLMKVLIPAGRITGWDMGNFCGYPNFSFYFLPPFLLAVIPSMLLGIPLTIALKWAIMSGIFLLPPAVYLGLRNMAYRFPVPIMAAAGALVLLFNESYTMFGANTLSTFAGEFCYMFAFALFIYFIGSFYRGYKSERRVFVNGILLGLIGLSHLFVFIPALFLLVYAFFDEGRVRYLFKVGLNAFAVMAFWILPLTAFRHPYTTPVYMIWQEFVNWRYFMAAVLIIFITVGPRLALSVIVKERDNTPARAWGFTVFCAGGAVAVAYLTFQYLLLGGDIWATRLHLPDLSTSPLGQMTAEKIQAWVFPIAGLSGLITAAIGMVTRRTSVAAFTAFCRVIGAVCFLTILLVFLVVLHISVVDSLENPQLRIFFLKRPVMALFYGPLLLALGIFFIFSRRFKTLLDQTAAGLVEYDRRFFMWLALVFGCGVAYFCAHFLQVPDIRFLPPMIYALGFIVCAETLGAFVIEKRIAIKMAAALTAVYLATVMIIFGAAKSDPWYRSNNRGYEMTAGFKDFSRVNHYLKTVYRQKGLSQLNAPRVAYEKCDLYGPYSGDRAFESLPLFSGRQTLEGIHFAGSIASHSMAYLQTEFSRDIKTPKPQILSKINMDALPAHFDLYNISQLIVMTRTVKRALSSSSRFEKEAVFGDIGLYRYVGCNQRYVDVPEIRPVLYTGKKWTDDFYAWFQDPQRVDVLLVPDRFVGDDDDRAVFSGKTDSIHALDAFRKNRLNRDGLKIETHLDHLKIRFTTNKIGLPHLVKVSYFPNWQVKGARDVYPVSPHLMMVIPRAEEVLLTYEMSSWEIIGLMITGGWIVFALGMVAYKRTFSAQKKQSRIRAGKLCNGMKRVGEALERNLIRFRPLILLLLLLVALGLVTAGAALRNRPVRIYEAGYHAYTRGSQFLQEGREKKAAEYFHRAVEIMRPLLAKRASFDHRDVINALLVTAMCHENLKEYQTAESWYRTLISAYPRSRYVGEGYVKLARIYKWRVIPLFQECLNLYRQGKKEAATERYRQGLRLMEKSLDHYLLALQKDPYSVWARYALTDLENEGRYLEGFQKRLLSVSDDLGLQDRLEKMRERVTAGKQEKQ